MWWFRITAAALLALMLAACTGGSFYSDAQYRDLGALTLKSGDSRIDQLYRRQLDRLLARHAAGERRYELTINLVADSTEDAVTMAARLSLYDLAGGVVVDEKTLGSSASIGATASLYGAEEARRFARERLATNLADKTYHYLVVYFSRSRDSERSERGSRAITKHGAAS